MKPATLALSLAALAATPGLVRASVYDFSLSGTGYSASGMLTTAGDLSPSGTLITGISGIQNGNAITGLRAPGTYPSGSQANDNLLFSGTPSLDDLGFSFKVGMQSFNVCFTGGAGSGYYEFSTPGAMELASFVLSSPTAVPEPASLALLAVGLLTMSAAYARRRA